MTSPLSSLLLDLTQTEERFYGVTIGLVTNNQDPEGLGRVKVKLPWMSDQDESDWARIATPMAGANRGLYLLPEKDDEVLVAFENGRLEVPYILGALWNGQDTPPESNKDASTKRRTLRSSTGHIVCLDDTDGKEKIEIIDKSQKNSIIIDTVNNTITIAADADITLQSAQGKLILKGKGISLQSEAEVEIKATQAMDVEAQGNLTLKGQMVNIN